MSPERLAASGSEDGEQMALMCWAAQHRAELPALEWLYHVPNGGSRHKAEAGKLKAMGVKRGVPDLHLDVCAGQFAGLVIEMKTANYKPSDDAPEHRERQERWLQHAREQHRVAHQCHGWRAAAAILAAYLGRPDLAPQL